MPRTRNTTRKLKSSSGDVDTYISKYSKEIQSKLMEIRAAIKQVAPDATETMSYFDMPGYSYPGYDYSGMFAWFGFQKSFIGLYLRPPTIQNHADEVREYETTKAIVRFPLDKKVPVSLVKKLVRASLNIMKEKKSSRSQPKKGKIKKRAQTLKITFRPFN